MTIFNNICDNLKPEALKKTFAKINRICNNCNCKILYLMQRQSDFACEFNRKNNIMQGFKNLDNNNFL